MHKKIKGCLLVSALGFAGLAGIARNTRAQDEDARGPVFAVAANVHGAGYQVKQLVAGGRGSGVEMVTRLGIASAIPPGPPQIEGAVPPGPPQIEHLTIRVSAGAHGVAHAAGLLLAVGLAEGLPAQQIEGVFAQLQWPVQFRVEGTVAPIGADRAAGLSNLIAAGLDSDRPGGGCDGALALFQTGAHLLGLPATCAPAPAPNQQ